MPFKEAANWPSRFARLPQSSLKYGMPFAVATCPKCSEQFRRKRRIGKRKLPVSTVIRLTCPSCAHALKLVAGWADSFRRRTRGIPEVGCCERVRAQEVRVTPPAFRVSQTYQPDF